MTPFDVDQESPENWGFVQTVDRREFLRLTGTGLLVSLMVDGMFGRVDVSAFQGRGGGPPADVKGIFHEPITEAKATIESRSW